MIKKTLIIIASIVLVGYLYNVYCDHFWSNYWKEHAVYGENDATDEITAFSFKPSPEIPEDSVLNINNFRKYTWHRELIEPYHGLWINEVTLSFTNDTTIKVQVDPHYIDDNWWNYPLTRRFKYDRETYIDNYYFNHNEMIFVRKFESQQVGDSLYSTPPDTVHLELNGDNVFIKHVFL